MSMFASIIEGLDSAFIWLGGVAKQNFADYCDLETAQDSRTLVAKDGSLVSLIRIDGVKKIVGDANFVDAVVSPLERTLTQPMQTKTHMLQFFFVSDPDRTEDEIRRMTESARATMHKLNLDMEDMLEERVRNLSQWTNYEASYVAVWTRPYALTKAEKKHEQKKKAQANQSVAVSLARSQNPNAGIYALNDRHQSFVESMLSDLKGAGIACMELRSHEAAREIRACIDADFTSHDWMASLPGDKITPQLRKGFVQKEEWDIVWPKLSWQLTPRDATIISANAVQVGSRIYAPVYISLFPRDPAPFKELFGRLMNRHLPWRMSFTIEGDGLGGMAFKKLMSQLLAFSSGENSQIKNAIEGLQEVGNQEAIVRVRCSFCTWGPKSDPDLLTKRASDLARAIEGWGSCDVSETTGDPLAGFASSALAFTSANVGVPAAAPLAEALYMMPLTRPSSPWKFGAVTFRSPDGKLLPYQPGSTVQTTWISLVFAKPGSGKSVLMNMTNLALCLSPGIKRLPKIAIIDIGPSSAGLISLLKEALPATQRHLAAYYRLRMTKDYSVNPFDTQLGCRAPTSLERQFLINFVSLLVTDISQESPPMGMPGLVTMVIDEMYRKASDKEQPHPYAAGVERAVDEAVKKSLMRIDRRTTWWEIVDHLFSHGMAHEAGIAQRHAVPVLAEAALCAKDEKIRNIYEEVRISDTGENLITAFTRMVGDALQYYPILARPTAFDIGEARVVSLDLDEVAKTGGPVADRQTAVMYMLARYILAKDFYITEEALPEMPFPATMEAPETVPVKPYRDFHRLRIEEIREDLKRICYDEFHRTTKARTVRDQVLVDMREGRKWAVDVTLASQALEDFDPTMQEFATGIFVMDGGNAQTVKKISDAFGFADPAEQSALINYVTGPKAGGATFMAKFSTKEGWYTMLLTSTLGPIELWAFSTTASDVAIRNKLYQKVGPKLARQLLAYKYKGGSAAKDVEERREKLKSAGNLVDADGSDIVEEILNELLEVKRVWESKGIN